VATSAASVNGCTSRTSGSRSGSPVAARSVGVQSSGTSGPASVEAQADVGPAARAHRAQRRGLRLVDEGEEAVRPGSAARSAGTAPGRRAPRCPGARSRCRARRGRCCACRRPRRRTGRARRGPSRARTDAVGPVAGPTSGSPNRISPPAGARRRRGPVRAGPAGRPAAARG
jgi:hypothetical protein